jgi:general nucleoside transport system ATP-binding protein
MSTDAPLVRLEGITKAYPGVVANYEVTLDLRAGEIHAVVGENGAGKTTLMGILYGLHRADAGRILIDGHHVTIHSPRDALRLGIGYVQQHFSLIPTLTVAENLVLALRAGGVPVRSGEGRARVRALSKRYRFDVDPDARVERLSVGQQQRAELIKALARDTRILLLDEPNTVLTPQESDELGAILRGLAKSGAGIFLISHKLEEVLRVSNRISVLRHGHHVATVEASAASRSQLATLMVGELRSEESVSGARAGIGAARLEVSDLWVGNDHGGYAVRGASFTVRGGEVLGIAGLEGSGQVELTEALAGVRRAEHGSIRIDGREVSRLGVEGRQRVGVALVPADRARHGLIGTLSVAENLLLPVAGRRPYSRLGFLRREAMRQQARSLISRFDIRVPAPEVSAGALSGGNQQKMVVARELSRDPVVVVCCYPTFGLDFAATEAVQREILQRQEANAAIIYASTDLEELLALSDRIIVLHSGTITGELPAGSATSEQLGLLMSGAEAA